MMIKDWFLSRVKQGWLSLDGLPFAILVLTVLALPLQITKQIFPVYILDSYFPVLDASRFLIVLGLFLLVVKHLRGNRLIIPKDQLSLALFAFVGLAWASFFIFPSMGGVREAIRYSVYFGFFLYIINSVRGSKDFKAVFYLFIATGAVAALFSVFQYLSGIYLWNGGLDSVLRRVNATFWDPNVFGSFLGLIVIFSISAFSWLRKKPAQVFVGLTAAISLCALFYTFSRGSLAALLVSGSVLVMLLPKNRKMLLLYLALVAVFISTAIVVPSVRERAVNIYDIAVKPLALVSSGSAPLVNSEILGTIAAESGCSDSVEERFSLRHASAIDRISLILPLNRDRLFAVKAGISMLLDNPFFGVGLGNFQSAYLNDYCYLIAGNGRSKLSGDPITLSHNSFITIAAEWGLVGVVWLLWFISRLFTCAVGALRETAASPFVGAPVSGILLIILQSLLTGNLFSNPYFWFLVGILVWVRRLTLDQCRWDLRGLRPTVR